jgi:hypothetical protein
MKIGGGPCFGYADVFVGTAVVEEPTVTSADHALYENYIRDLADLLPAGGSEPKAVYVCQ